MTTIAKADPVVVETPADGVARLRLNRTDRRNAFDEELREALDACLSAVLADEGVRAIVLTGSSEVFSAGGDLRSMHGLGVRDARLRLAAGHRLVRRLAAAEKPVVAAVGGAAVGAAVGLMLLCDLIVAGRGSRIGFPYLQLALVPDWGIAATLPARVGPARGRRLLLDRRFVDADRALDIGLVDEVVEDAQLDAAALARAADLASLPRDAVALTKHLLTAGDRLERVLELEAAAQALCLVSDDAAEGRAAFMDKREPSY